MQIKTNKKSGFTLVEIMIVVAIIGLLAAIAVPNFLKARKSTQATACIANLTQIRGAKEVYAFQNNLAPDAAITEAQISGSADRLIVKLINQAGGTGLRCPADSDYVLGLANVDPSCAEYFDENPDPHTLTAPVVP
jgi:prepilin-type N-terminal cleavage/methylation domain-containing protein